VAKTLCVDILLSLSNTQLYFIVYHYRRPVENQNVWTGKALRGHGKGTTPATIEWAAAADLPTPTSHYKLVASVGSLPCNRHKLR
jgi:hypothetical protein